MDFITAIENKLGKTIEKNMMPLHAGDVPATFADVTIWLKIWIINRRLLFRRGLTGLLIGIGSFLITENSQDVLAWHFNRIQKSLILKSFIMLQVFQKMRLMRILI